jgi:hypothetical protein
MRRTASPRWLKPVFLSDENLREILDRNAKEALPRPLFAALCMQAMRSRGRILISRIRITELLDDPHNQHSAAMPMDILDKLCRQAMSTNND